MSRMNILFIFLMTRLSLKKTFGVIIWLDQLVNRHNTRGYIMNFLFAAPANRVVFDFTARNTHTHRVDYVSSNRRSSDAIIFGRSSPEVIRIRPWPTSTGRKWRACSVNKPPRRRPVRTERLTSGSVKIRANVTENEKNRQRWDGKNRYYFEKKKKND